MKLLVVGTLAFDSIETPYEKRADVLGGSATHFAHAACYFGPVRLVAVVGTDFPDSALEEFQERRIDCAGIEVADGKSFRWSGRYEADWNTRHTLDTQLNVFADFDPKVPKQHTDAEFVFLANAEPAVQAKALDQCKSPKLVVADTMNLWIDSKLGDLEALLRRLDGLVINDEEARMLTGRKNLFQAARQVLELGPKFVIIKKGEHGSFLISKETRFALPAYPIEDVVDPTGAGDSFAGGFLGYIASVRNTSAATLRRAMLYGTVTASFSVEAFGIDGLKSHDRSHLEERFNQLHQYVTL
jgi:sugar/nucleoside kinase (ribokinase family)